jgi:hypothetical protein
VTVKISVVNGVAFVDEVPAGVTVQVTDYDVDYRSRECDEEGTPCSRYTVSSTPMALQGGASLEKVAA